MARQQEKKAIDHDQIVIEQEQSWSDDDQEASRRDELSASEDQRVADLEFDAGGDAAMHLTGALARERSHKARGIVSIRRDETTAERAQGSPHPDPEKALRQGERDREMAASDRIDAADDRQEAAHERADAALRSTEAAGAAERAIATLESMSDAFFTLDPEWRFTYLNPQTDALLKRPREGLAGKCIWDEFPEAIGSRFDDEYRRAMRDRVPVRFEQMYEPLGTIFEVRAYPVDGGLAVYFTDVTAQRRRDTRLRQTQRLETLGQLTAGIAHDFRNVLTVVDSYAGLGKADAPNAVMVDYFEHISSASQKAQAMTSQLLAFARQQDLSPATIDLNDVALGLSPIFQQLMRPGIGITFDLSPVPVTVFVDRSQLEQVMLNLVVNSRDAITDSGLIRVSTTSHDPRVNGHEVVDPWGWLQVTDTGGGISEDVLPRIFDPFFSTKPPGEGTGLGLATIYGIVTQSAGHVFVESKVGEGTTMTVALPPGPPGIIDEGMEPEA